MKDQKDKFTFEEVLSPKEIRADIELVNGEEFSRVRLVQKANDIYLSFSTDEGKSLVSMNHSFVKAIFTYLENE